MNTVRLIHKKRGKNHADISNLHKQNQVCNSKILGNVFAGNGIRSGEDLSQKISSTPRSLKIKPDHCCLVQDRLTLQPWLAESPAGQFYFYQTVPNILFAISHS